MTEFYTVKRIDNSRLVRAAAPHLCRDSCRRVALGVALAAAMMLYAWQHFECLQLGYQLEELKAGKSQAAELNQQLHLEVDSLRAPMRIDAIARNRLGLTVPLPGQVSPIEPLAEPELAQARTVSLPMRQ
jgi:cell division protein FtsL